MSNQASNAADVSKKLRDQLTAMQKSLKLQMFRALTMLEVEIVNNIRSKSGLMVGSGALLNSIGASKAVVQDSAGNVTGTIGPQGVVYAAIQEFGGIIRPVNKNNLTIPVQENRRKDGSPIVTIRDLMAQRGAGLSFIAKGVIFQKQSKDDKIPQPMFILKNSVTIPSRPYLRPALVAKQDQILKDFGVFLMGAFKNSK